jgi:hypothetical protein
VGDAAVPVTLIVLTGVAGVNVTVLSAPLRATWLAGGPIATFVIFASAPAAGVAYGVRKLASDELPSRTLAQRLDLVIALQRLLQRLLSTGGGILALATFLKGAELALEHSLHAVGSRPIQYVLIYGGFGTLFVALIYLPARGAVMLAASHLRDEMFPMADIDGPSAILTKARERQEFEKILGVDRSILADLEIGLPILAPLLAGAVAVFLPH